MVTVLFRRDHLGAGAGLPIAPMTVSQNGAKTSITGALKATSEDWVVVDGGGRDHWFARDSVLLIAVPKR